MLQSHTPRARLQVRLYDTLVANTLELNDLAAHVGGAAGEMLMDECTAKVGVGGKAGGALWLG